MKKSEFLDSVKEIVTGPREADYGTAHKNFTRIAHLQAIVEECPDPLAKVALMNIVQKVARLIETPNHLDSWKDIAGYACCGAEVTSVATSDEKGHLVINPDGSYSWKGPFPTATSRD